MGSERREQETLVMFWQPVLRSSWGLMMLFRVLLHFKDEEFQSSQTLTGCPADSSQQQLTSRPEGTQRPRSSPGVSYYEQSHDRDVLSLRRLSPVFGEP